MTFRDWQQLSPAAAAQEVHARVRSRLRSGQARAAIAHLADEATLAERLAKAPADAPLRGVPFFAKDLFEVGGEPMLAGSTFLPEARPTPVSDGAFVRAVRSKGAALAGRAHMHEFAYGITGENPHYGDCEHPQFPGRTTGGSSSGSAALVAAGIVPLALGSDTGGSVRVPAAFCNLYGFRLTPGTAWISDALALAPSYDTAGWFTAGAADMQAAVAALVGLTPSSTRALRGGYLELPGLDPEVAEACRTAAARYAPPLDNLLAADLRAAFAPGLEAYHTTVALEAWEVHRNWAEPYRERYDPLVWQRVMRGPTITPEQRTRAADITASIRTAWRNYFSQHDFLLLPGTPCAAPTKAECTLETRNRVLTVTAPASIGGLPVLTIPVALSGGSGLSTGLQVVVANAQSPVIAWALEVART